MKKRLKNAAKQIRNACCTTAKALVLATAAWAGAQGITLAQTIAAANIGAKAVITADWAKIVEAAKNEDSGTICSAQGLLVLDELADRFKKEYGITLQVVRQ